MATSEPMASERMTTYDLSPELEPVAGQPAAPRIHHTTQRAAPVVPAPRPYVAPIDRRDMDRFKPWFYLLVAGGFFVLSLVSTVAQVGAILRIGGVQLAAWQYLAAGLLVAGIITAGELMTGEGMVYFAFLIPDVVLTVWWLWPVLLRWSSAVGTGAAGAAVMGMALGIFSAWLPERVILGRRRRQR